MLPEGWDKLVGDQPIASTARIGARRLAGHVPVIHVLPGTKRFVDEHGNDLEQSLSSAGHARHLHKTAEDVGTTAPQPGHDQAVSMYIPARNSLIC